MIENTIAKRYARALLLVAQEKNAVDIYGAQLKAFCGLCVGHQTLLATLSNRFADLQARKNVVKALAKKLDLSPHLTNFLTLLIQKGRIEFLALVNEEYQKLADQFMGRAAMRVVSAAELTQNQYNGLTKIFSQRVGKTMILEKRIDPSLLGGLRVHVGDQVFDYTLQTQLEQMKNRMMK